MASRKPHVHAALIAFFVLLRVAATAPGSTGLRGGGQSNPSARGLVTDLLADAGNVDMDGDWELVEDKHEGGHDEHEHEALAVVGAPVDDDSAAVLDTVIDGAVPVARVRMNQPMLRQSYVTRGWPADYNPRLTFPGISQRPLDDQVELAQQKQKMLQMATVISMDFVGTNQWQDEHHLGVVDRCIGLTQQRAAANSAIAAANSAIRNGQPIPAGPEGGLQLTQRGNELDGWMTALSNTGNSDDLYSVPIAQMLLAGSHDALSIGPYTEISQLNLPDAVNQAIGLKRILDGIATTQTESFAQQLRAGARWFDVRFGQAGSIFGDGEVRGMHGPLWGDTAFEPVTQWVPNGWSTYYDKLEEIFNSEDGFRDFARVPRHRNEIIILAARTFSEPATQAFSDLFRDEERKPAHSRDFTVVSKTAVQEWLRNQDNKERVRQLLPTYTSEEYQNLELFGDLTIELLNEIYRPGVNGDDLNGAFVIVVNQDLKNGRDGLGWFETGAWSGDNFVSMSGSAESAETVHTKGVDAVQKYRQALEHGAWQFKDGPGGNGALEYQQGWRTFPELDSLNDMSQQEFAAAWGMHGRPRQAPYDDNADLGPPSSSNVEHTRGSAETDTGKL